MDVGHFIKKQKKKQPANSCEELVINAYDLLVKHQQMNEMLKKQGYQINDPNKHLIETAKMMLETALSLKKEK